RTGVARAALVRLPASVEELEQLAQAGRHLRAVRVHVRVLLGGEPGDEDRLLLAVLADAAGAVARAEARRLRAAHRQLQRRVVDQRVVDADRAGLDAAGDLLGVLGVLAE